MEETSKFSLTSNTTISFGLLITIIGGILWINNSFNNFQLQITELKTQIAAIQTILDSNKENRLTKSEAAEAALRAAILNPGMRIPDPRNLNLTIVVSSGKIQGDGT